MRIYRLPGKILKRGISLAYRIFCFFEWFYHASELIINHLSARLAAERVLSSKSIDYRLDALRSWDEKKMKKKFKTKWAAAFIDSNCASHSFDNPTAKKHRVRYCSNGKKKKKKQNQTKVKIQTKKVLEVGNTRNCLWGPRKTTTRATSLRVYRCVSPHANHKRILNQLNHIFFSHFFSISIVHRCNEIERKMGKKSSEKSELKNAQRRKSFWTLLV